MFTTFILGFGLFGSVFVFPIFCQNLLGFTAQQTGELLIPGGLATIFMMPMVGKLLQRKVPPQIMATGGFILFFIFTYLMSNSSLSSGESDFYLPLIIRGTVSYTHLRAHETVLDLVCRLLLEKKKTQLFSLADD